MLQISLDLTTLEVNARFYKLALNREMKRVVTEGGKAFLLEVFPRVPVWSGMARGSLLNLGRLVKVPIPIVPKSDVISRISLGKRLGTSSREIIKKVKDTKGLLQWRFKYRSDVPHYEISDVTASISPTSPWHSFEAGRTAFFAEVQDRFRHPKLEKYVIKSTVTVTKTGRVRRQRTVRPNG